MPFDIEASVRFFVASLPSLPISLLLAIVSVLLGLPLACLIALAMQSGGGRARAARAWIVTVRATPVVLILLLSYFLLPAMVESLAAAFDLPISASAVPLPAIVVVAFTLGITPSLAEAVRGALNSVPVGQLDAAYAVGMTRSQALTRILAPQTVPVLIPQVTNLLIGCFKATSLAFLVSVTDVLNAATMEAARTYQYSEAYAAVALLYLIVCHSAGWLAGAAEALARRAFWGEGPEVDRYRIAAHDPVAVADAAAWQ